MGRRHWGMAAGITAVTAVTALMAAGLPAAAVAPPSATQSQGRLDPRGLKEDVTGPGLSRLVLGEEFSQRLRDLGVRVLPLGNADLRGIRTLEIPVSDSFADGYRLDGGFRLESDKGRFSCPALSVYPRGGRVFCLREAGPSWRLLSLAGEPESTYANRYYSDAPRAAAPVGGIVDDINGALGVALLEEGIEVGTLETVRKRPLLKASYDQRTSCEIDNWAGDNSINRGWALQALVNQIPQDVTISQLGVAKGKATLTTPDPAPINIGQRTPNMEGIRVTDSKQIVRGSQYSTDHFWDGYSYSCSTNAPFIVGPGAVNDPKVKTWNYDGQLRTPSNSGGARPQWWGHARQTNYDGPTGWYTWTCRDTPNGKSGGASDTFWGKVNSGTGFVGDGSDTGAANAGRAPACQNDVMKDLKFTTRYSISKRGGLEARSDQGTYPRSCSVDGAAPVGCWQEIYSGGWLRAWAFQYKIFATALRSEISSGTRMAIPAGYEVAEDPTVRDVALSWRIVGANINEGDGTWPSFTSGGEKYDFSTGDFRKGYDGQDFAKSSPYTVPGGGSTFSLGGWGQPEGAQSMTFLLVGDSDGTWTWPTNAKGDELERPRVRVSLGFKVSNFDDKGSCESKIMGDSSSSSTDSDDKTGRHCIEGIVPTLWPLPSDSKQFWYRVHDAMTKDGKPTEPNIDKAKVEVVPAACWSDTNFKFSDQSNYQTVPDVSANFTWKLYLAGAFNNYSGTGCR
ncbi:MAG: hypothetical protein ACKOT0_07495 [bacterium]